MELALKLVSLNKYMLSNYTTVITVVTICICFLFSFPLHTYAQEQSVQQYDCSQTGRCIVENSSQETALYFDTLAPGIVQTQVWQLENNSSSQCRVYLRLKLLDDQLDLSQKINISAVGSTQKQEKTIIAEMSFSKLLKRQSIYLGNLPKNSTGEITWTVGLHEDTTNEFQNASEKFNTLLYSYCLTNNEGNIKGVSTEDQKNIDALLYGFLSITSFSYLVYSHFRRE